MRCKSIVGIWPETPPSHHVTAVAVLDYPLTLYTGAADGSIVWWHLSDHLSSSKKIKPVALLCGHAAPIVDLCISYPLSASQDGNAHRHSDEVVDAAPSNQGALLSACSDGVLCVWSRGSGHCRRRRKLPPWVGSPSVVRMLPANKRYVCVASFFSDPVHSADHDSMDSSEGGEGDHESFGRKPPKCTIVIVDSCTLTIVQTVFHGNLALGPLKFMAVVESVDKKQKISALMVDSYGKIQCFALLEDSNVSKEGGNRPLDNSSPVNIAGLENMSCEGGLVVSVAISGDMLGLVYKTRCIFILVTSATIVGVISLENSVFHSGADCNLSHVTGSMFISSDNPHASKSEETHNMTDVKFSLWNDRGIAVIYEITYVDGIFKSEVICEIPAISCPMDVKLSINVVQMSNYFLRVESICCHDEEPFLWRPYITMWSLHKPLDDFEILSKSCKLLGKGNFLVDWVDKTSWTSTLEASDNASCKKAALTLGDDFTGQEGSDALCKDDLKYTFVQRERIVSSTMVISQHAQIPYAVVYGYHSGEIELVQFNRLTLLNSDGMNLHREMEPQEAKQKFSGHTSPVLCLASHHVVGTSTEKTCSWMLLSGSMDCTLRIWDLESGNPIMVMHHHVAPVRQIILPPLPSDYPWSNCFLSVGDDSCVTLVSLETLRVERMFPGHPSYPAKVVWDVVKGYLACLSQDYSVASGAKDALFIWDIKAGSRERVLRGTAAHSMFNNFCKGLGISNVSGYASSYNTSSSSLHLPLMEDLSSLPSRSKKNQSNASSEGNLLHSMSSLHSSGDRSLKLSPGNSDKRPIRCSCPISGVAIIGFDLLSLISPDLLGHNEGEEPNGIVHEMRTPIASSQQETMSSDSSMQGKSLDTMGKLNCNDILRLRLLQFSLSFMHFWSVDFELDDLLMMEMGVKRYENSLLAPGLEGDRGSISLAFPAFSSVLQLWKSSSEFCALRSLTMVSLSQSMVSLSNSYSGASSALSAFYTRNFAEKILDAKPPSLQLLVSFWQNEDEHVRMAARSLFHCAASRAIPQSLCCARTKDVETGNGCSHVESSPKVLRASQNEEAEITKWLESFELQDWVSCVGGTSQDAMASHIIVAAALAIWYPSLVKPNLAMFAVHPLMKLVMAMNEKYSSTAAELLAEGMDSTWKECINSEIPRLIGDIFFQIECVSGASVSTSPVGPVVPPKLREVLVSTLLPSLSLADIPGFLSVIEGLIWSTASDSPVHLISLKTLIRLMRGSPRNLAQYLNKVVNFILHTMDPANSVMRKTCLQVSMATLREVVRVYPMVALNDSSTRLAVGDAAAEVNSANIHVYDMPSVTKIKVLDASGPPGLPTLFSGAPETFTTAISALSFSPDGEGIVAFSEHGLVIRWWSLGSAWWEKLSRNFVPVQCTKLILVPPWEGFSSNSSRASIMAHIEGNGRQEHSQEHIRSNDEDGLNLLLYNLDLSYRLEWVGDRKVLLCRHGQELGTFIIQ